MAEERITVIKNAEQFDEVLQAAGSKLVVVDFYADWCGPCRNIAPKVKAMAECYPDVDFVKVNVDECGELAQKYGVSGIPHFAFFKNSNQIEHFSGANEDILKATIEKLR